MFGILMAFRSGRWKGFNGKARFASLSGAVVLFLAPPVVSLFLMPKPAEGELDVFIAQPNIDVYDKFGVELSMEVNRI